MPKAASPPATGNDLFGSCRQSARLPDTMINRANRRTLSLLLLATLLLRAAIPDGYMPAALGEGALFKLCPSGMPATVMAALTGAEHDQHHQHHQHNGADGANDAHFNASQCPIGHMLTPVIGNDNYELAVAISLPHEYTTPNDPILVSATAVKPRSRGPPA